MLVYQISPVHGVVLVVILALVRLLILEQLVEHLVVLMAAQDLLQRQINMEWGLMLHLVLIK